MVNPVLDGHEELDAGEGDPLSEESERKILEMVRDQLDRRNPPDTEVLYRRAMHFIDRDVRHLSLQQFNAKFPLQVKRQRARDRPAKSGSSAAGSRSSGNAASHQPTAGPGNAGGTDVRTAEQSLPRRSSHRPQARGRKMAVDRNPAVMEMVERELRENPEISNEDLKLKAEEIDEDVADLSARQFNARYPLQVKRKLSSVKSKVRDRRSGDGSRAPSGSEEQREAVREALLDFAKAVAGAGDRGEVIDVLTGVDEYVDRVVEQM